MCDMYPSHPPSHTVCLAVLSYTPSYMKRPTHQRHLSNQESFSASNGQINSIGALQANGVSSNGTYLNANSRMQSEGPVHVGTKSRPPY